MEAIHNNWNPCIHQVLRGFLNLSFTWSLFLPQILQFFFDFFPQSIKSMKYKQALALHTWKCTIQAL